MSERKARFEIVRTAAGWHSRFRAANGAIVWTTEVYKRRRAADAAVDLIHPGPVLIRDVDEREPDLLAAAMFAYQTAGSPEACPRCSAWDGPRLPMCTDEGWSHAESCALINYADDVCVACEKELTRATTIPLPWTKPPISGNRERTNVHAYAAKVRDTRDAAFLAIRAAKVAPRDGANVTLHYRAPDKRRRDADNLNPVLKVCQDALVAANVLPDDSWVHIPRAACQIHPPTADGPAMWLTLEEIPMHELNDPDHATTSGTDSERVARMAGGAS